MIFCMTTHVARKMWFCEILCLRSHHMVDSKTITVKYPHYLDHSLMIRVEKTLRRSPPLEVAACRCQLTLCLWRACQMERSGEEIRVCTGLGAGGVHSSEDARECRILSCIHKAPNSIECEERFPESSDASVNHQMLPKSLLIPFDVITDSGDTWCLLYH